jgi:imidazolonepropionase-like amidohydrolase
MMKFAFLALVLTIPFTGLPQDRILIHHARIVDVHTGTLKKADAILVYGETIEKIGLEKDFGKTKGISQRIDAGGGYVIPGLWDMHVHLEGLDLVEDNEALLPLFLAYGITTVRDCASNLGEQVLQWREDIRAGKRLGPTIFTAGRKLEGKNSIWERDLEISNETELRDSLNWLDSQKVDFIKITENTLQGPLFMQAVRAARARGYQVSGHVPYDLTIQELADAGFSSIEHASYLLRLGSDENLMRDSLARDLKTRAEAERDYLLHFDQARAIDAYRVLGKQKLFVCPTLIGGRQLAYMDSVDHGQDPFRQYLTERFQSKYAWRINRMAGETPEQKKQRKDRYNLIKAQLPYVNESGMLIIAGSDAAALNTFVYPAESLVEELEIFQEAGLPPKDILRSATLNGALFFRKEKTCGSIDEGQTADLVILSGNPLENITAIRGVWGVVARGKYFNRSALDSMLEKARQEKTILDRTRK